MESKHVGLFFLFFACYKLIAKSYLFLMEVIVPWGKLLNYSFGIFLRVIWKTMHKRGSVAPTEFHGALVVLHMVLRIASIVSLQG